MNRHALRASAEEQQRTAAHDFAAAGLQSAEDTRSQAASTLASDGKELVEKAFAYADRTIRENPTLVIAGVAAVGALSAIVLKGRRTESSGTARRLKRDIARQTRELRHAIRDEMRASGAAERLTDLSRSLSGIDWRPYLQSIVDQAATLAKQASEKVSSISK
jgi:hypothetical protein